MPFSFRPSRRPALTIFAAAAVAGASLLVPLAGLASAARAHKASGVTIHVIEHAVTDTVVHSGGTGDKNGNTLTFHNKISDPADKKQVGADQGFCMRINPAAGSWECFWTTFLAGGQITVEGPYYDKANSILAITGGTGRFRDARGQMNLNSRNGGTEYDFIFHLDG